MEGPKSHEGAEGAEGAEGSPAEKLTKYFNQLVNRFGSMNELDRFERLIKNYWEETLGQEGEPEVVDSEFGNRVYLVDTSKAAIDYYNALVEGNDERAIAISDQGNLPFQLRKVIRGKAGKE